MTPWWVAFALYYGVGKSLPGTLGLGATFAGLVGAFPQIVWLSEHKSIVFGVAGSLISVAAILHYRARNAPCPLDQDLAKACMRTRKVSMVVLSISVLAYFIGVFFAYIAPDLF